MRLATAIAITIAVPMLIGGDNAEGRRANLDAVIPYQEPAPKGDSVDINSTLSSTLPMAAIFMRNRYMGW